MEKTKKALIYARQSSGNDDFSDSVENQIVNCKKLAEKENLEVIGIFQDLNTSGKTYPEGAETVAENDRAFQEWYSQQTGTKKYRAGLGSVMEYLSKVDYVIVDDMTRLYRPVTRSFLESFINQAFADAKVEILQVKGGKLNLAQFDQVLIQTLKNQIQDEAIANQKAKSMQQFKKMKDNGIFPNGGGKNFALRYAGKGKIEVIENEAEIIRYVYNEIEKYTPYLHIINAVNQKWGHLFKRCFYESNFYHIAKNPIYAGYMYNTQGMLIPNTQLDKAIISFEQWNNVQKIMESKKRNPPKAKYRWLPFSGLLYCGNCGSKLVCGTDKTGTYYFCNAGRNLKKVDDCRASRVVMTTRKENYVGLKEAIAPLLVMSLFAEIDRQDTIKQDAENIDALKVELANMGTKQKQIAELLIKGLLDAENVETILTEHKAKISNLQQKIMIAENAQKELSECQKHLQNTFKKFEAMKLIDDELTDTEYEILLKKTVNRIDVFATEIKIYTVYGDFVLPRYIVSNRRNFPVPRLIVNGRTAETLNCRVIYYTGTKSVLADFGKIKIETM